MRGPLTALLASLLLAVGVPLGWWATRPATDVGAAVTSIGQPSTPPVASLSSAPVLPANEVPPSMEVLPSPPVPLNTGAVPVRLEIPAIRVDAPVVPVGVEPDGSMTVPPQANAVGWYRFGPRPGDGEGAAVLAGHVDARSQGAGALFRLRELGVGAQAVVRRSDGTPVRYRVVGRQEVVKRQLPLGRLFARDGSPRLVLITCGGPFLADVGSYRDNVVVVAVPEGP